MGLTVQHPVAKSNEKSLFGDLTPTQFYTTHNVTHSSTHITNARGLKLFTQHWAPLPPTSPIGCIALVHGYTGESSWLLQLTAILFAQHGFIVCAIDHQGHGFSDSLDGLIHHIPDLNPVVDDCVAYFQEFRDSHARGLRCFLYSESLGGAIALYVSLCEKGAWDGLVLNGAMCGISDKFKPPWPLEHLLFLVAAVVPTWRVVPTRGSIPDLSFKVEWKRKLALASPKRSVARPRAATANEFLRVCRDLQGRFEEVDVPLLVVHGEGDVVCDPECVKELYSRASSSDKTLKIYPEMWHQLVGEPEESVNLVFGDIVEWLITRANAMRGENARPVA